MKNTNENSKRVIVLGAGIGGLYVANALGEANFSVEVYEKRTRDALGYPWHDSIDKDTFRKADINVPEHFYMQKQILDFYSPSGDGYIRQGRRASKNFDIDRKKLIELLINTAEKTCDIAFGVEPDGLIVEGDSVAGIYIGGEPRYCDLVIDSSGIFSKYRAQTPEKFLIGDALNPCDYLMAYRGFYKKTNATPCPSNVYLMPEGYSVLWCKDSPDPTLSDVLISNFASVSDEQIAAACEYLRKRNPLLTDECVVCAKDAIPVRYPLATTVADGYAVIGNAAFMTKPTSGSGIENTLHSAAILADVIKKANDFSAPSLWKYAVRTNLAFGSNSYMAYVARSRFQNLDKENLIWLFTSGILNDSLLALARFDIKALNDFKMDALVTSLHLAKEKRDFLRQIEGIIAQCVKSKLIAFRMPRVYNCEAIAKWKSEYDDFARG